MKKDLKRNKMGGLGMFLFETYHTQLKEMGLVLVEERTWCVAEPRSRPVLSTAPGTGVEPRGAYTLSHIPDLSIFYFGTGSAPTAYAHPCPSSSSTS